MPGLEDAIKTYLSNSQHDEPAWKIAKDLGANRSSVRVYLSRLEKRGIVERPKTGYYCIRPDYAVGNNFIRDIRLQNLHFYVEGFPVRREHSDHNEVIDFPEVSGADSARVTIEFGWKRKKLHWYVKADAGLDFYGLGLARKIVDLQLRLMGYDPPVDWIAEKTEFLKDFFGSWRFEGMPSCVTFTDVSGLMEKIYNKKYGVRKEIRVTPGAQTLEGLMVMMQGGISYGQLFQEVAVTNQNVNRMMSYLEQQSRVMNAILERISKP